ncbi:MAG: SUMF1/EgtB/PvdO family nonheme iron enzyme [Defluviicoccus sp.]|nr:MAG: SUMF1/EgtB/PvdO family nonheme iron enzyme [Defluviicoccus sp.]
MGTVEGGRTIRLLHLSDIHFRERTAWDADPLLSALTRFIGAEVERKGAPDLVAITGDLAFSGIEAEYDLARTWLDALWATFGELPRDRLLLVPGNHDVDRKKVGRMARLSQKDLLDGKSQKNIAAALADDEERRVLVDRHAAYLKFLSGWLDAEQPLPWWERSIPIGETTVHVAGLDSAWMACGDDDRGHLLLGRLQLNQTVLSQTADGADWRIALLHHPWDYLAEFDCHEARTAIHQHRDLLLRGHLHFPQTERILPPDASRACLELAAGCVYEDSQYPNAFQWIELGPEKRVRVDFRALIQGAWTIDRNQPGCPEGHADYPLQIKSERPKIAPAGRSVTAAIPPEYVAWLRRCYEQVDLLGAKQGGRSVTLDHVYVPALVRPPASKAAEPDPDKLEEQKPIPLLQRLDAESLYIPAPAGAGKSTFCRWAVLQSIAVHDLAHPVPPPEEFAESVPVNLRGRLPLLVPLRELWRRMPCGRGERVWHRADLERVLASWIDASPPDGLTGDLLIAHMKAGSVFLLLDGLDEVALADVRDRVTCYPRDLLLSGLADALPAWLKAGNQVLLTSRPYGLDDAGLHRLGLPQAPLEALPSPLQDLFVARWFHTLGKPEKTVDLIATIRGRDDLGPLVENPMLLTAICVLYDNGGQLPEDRYQLYKEIVRGVLHNRYPGDASQRDPVERRLEAVALGMHLGDGEAPRTTPAAEVGWIEVERWLARFAELNPATESGQTAIADRREDLLNRSGLLMPRPNDRAMFYHLSFQEFLAAQRLARLARLAGRANDVEDVFRERRSIPEWRSTLLFLFAAQIVDRDAEWGLGLLARLVGDQDRAAVKANPAPAVFVADALELCLAKNYAVPEQLKLVFRRLALHAIEDEVELQARHTIGLCLGRIDDPRVPSLRNPEAYIEVPAGTYPYGEEGGSVEIAKPFRIGRYPVTNGQYAQFIEDGGYGEVGWRWWSAEGLKWLHEHRVSKPGLWHDRRWNGPNQPVVGVSFWEAEAFCAWARGVLPSEQQWEAAARGIQGLTYPWGNDWEDDICNSYEAGLGVTSPVGLFPRARQAEFGIEDMAGNVWEWCDSFYDRSNKDFPDARVVRGGSWNSNRDFARAACRIGSRPGSRDDFIGFRVVCSSPIDEH